MINSKVCKRIVVALLFVVVLLPLNMLAVCHCGYENQDNGDPGGCVIYLAPICIADEDETVCAGSGQLTAVLLICPGHPNEVYWVEDCANNNGTRDCNFGH
jgi:hypothetical protein